MARWPYSAGFPRPTKRFFLHNPQVKANLTQEISSGSESDSDESDGESSDCDNSNDSDDDTEITPPPKNLSE